MRLLQESQKYLRCDVDKDHGHDKHQHSDLHPALLAIVPQSDELHEAPVLLVSPAY